MSFNRYNGWYSNPGELHTIIPRVVDEAISWNKKSKKPVLMSEYGADTVEGLHLVNCHFIIKLMTTVPYSCFPCIQLPSFIWSEEYQLELLSKHFKAFDILRNHRWFVGEFIWNFADFKTFPGNLKRQLIKSKQFFVKI